MGWYRYCSGKPSTVPENKRVIRVSHLMILALRFLRGDARHGAEIDSYLCAVESPY